ncbi:12623_t:CDS:2 [Rhizophagus irregularis]|nr:12623_t:CDS:2 [Rhizophagus irregularis]
MVLAPASPGVDHIGYTLPKSRWNPEQNLEFIQEDYDILRAEGIDGEAFLLLNLIEYREISLKFGPAKRLTMLAEEIMSDDIIS